MDVVSTVPELPEIDVTRAAHLAAQGVLLLDVREPDEWAAGHVAGAVHVPLGDLPAVLATLDRSRPIVAVCRSGNRSGKATRLLLEHGFDVVNMAGGMLAWTAAGLPEVGEAS